MQPKLCEYTLSSHKILVLTLYMNLIINLSPFVIEILLIFEFSQIWCPLFKYFEVYFSSYQIFVLTLSINSQSTLSPFAIHIR